MLVVFYKVDGGRLCGWSAEPPKRKRFQGTTMAAGRDLPHDLAQFVVEAALGLRHGFWGLLARGATFKSVAGRRLTGPGRQLVRHHARELDASERTANAHVTAWRNGGWSSVGPALDDMFNRWRALQVGEELRMDWPNLPTRDAARTRSGLSDDHLNVRRFDCEPPGVADIHAATLRHGRRELHVGRAGNSRSARCRQARPPWSKYSAGPRR